MYTKLTNPKVFRDPIYGNIKIEYQLFLNLIDTKEVQRLRRIRQLSGVSMVFHTAEHSRFGHALGTYEMARTILSENTEVASALSEYEHIVFMCAALLHDIGHGPFSHAFENVFSLSHETMTVSMILDSLTEVNKVLSIHPNLSHDVASVISHQGKFKIVESLISSQLDADRMDYLTRDAYFTGASYGIIDYRRIIRSMTIVNEQLVFKASGTHSIESYLMSRYHMYWQVYYHPVARSYEVILEAIYQRIKDLKNDNISIEADTFVLFDTLDNKNILSYIEIDDSYINGLIKQLINSSDYILKDLCNKFMNRKLFKYIAGCWDKNEEKTNDIKIRYEQDEILNRYYYKTDQVKQVAYLHNDTDITDNLIEIKILLPDGEIVSLAQYSSIVNGLLVSGNKIENRIFYGEMDE